MGREARGHRLVPLLLDYLTLRQVFFHSTEESACPRARALNSFGTPVIVAQSHRSFGPGEIQLLLPDLRHVAEVEYHLVHVEVGEHVHKIVASLVIVSLQF